VSRARERRGNPGKAEPTKWLNQPLASLSVPTRIDRTQEVAGSSPASSIPSIYRESLINISVRYEPRPWLVRFESGLAHSLVYRENASRTTLMYEP
jgi:hypothetical protein